MTQYGFYYDATKCNGCRVCQVACKDRNNLPVGELFRRMTSYETGKYPHPSMYHNSATCNHCEDPACVRNCPTTAMHKTEDGTVQHDDDKCLGCKACVMACPYDVPVYLEDKSIAGKCDSCANIRANGGNPVCVDACTMRALDFGDVEELKKKYGNDLSKDAAILPSSNITHPSTLIKKKSAMDDHDVSVCPL